ncbi:unnamed protein product [Vitrella brassicaformis CCMP3155]|uniref:AP2/ERF domain-containing protein n=1 Tax=Vitrella brassicaformis (strain CCMP3155) TaxID=1169540 RepID=A0A0G4H2Y3_VITBC|nr:unnamed protein product [Vitrella brassicaformis CCMP3155]|eukprot:CEM38054.1 unnamed protein product [Vitrella brassicaformis CCMP3155]
MLLLGVEGSGHHLRQEQQQGATSKQSGVEGVIYVKSNNRWRARWQEGGEEKTKSFSCKKYGDEEALQMAIDHRRAMERLHYRFDRRGVEMPVDDSEEERPKKKKKKKKRKSEGCS